MAQLIRSQGSRSEQYTILKTARGGRYAPPPPSSGSLIQDNALYHFSHKTASELRTISKTLNNKLTPANFPVEAAVPVKVGMQGMICKRVWNAPGGGLVNGKTVKVTDIVERAPTMRSVVTTSGSPMPSPYQQEDIKRRIDKLNFVREEDKEQYELVLQPYAAAEIPFLVEVEYKHVDADDDLMLSSYTQKHPIGYELWKMEIPVYSLEDIQRSGGRRGVADNYLSSEIHIWQLPFKAASALSIHAVMSRQLEDGAIADVAKAFAPAMVYEAASRVPDPELMYFTSIEERTIYADRCALSLYNKHKRKRDPDGDGVSSSSSFSREPESIFTFPMMMIKKPRL